MSVAASICRISGDCGKMLSVALGFDNKRYTMFKAGTGNTFLIIHIRRGKIYYMG